MSGPSITPATPRIDAHQHYWELGWSDYAWMEGHRAIRRNYGPDDLAPLLQEAGIAGTVLVQADATPRETDRLIELARRTPTVLGIVGWVDFAAANAVAQVEQRAREPLIRGLRPMLELIGDSDWILQPRFRPVLRSMVSMGLCFDALIHPRHLPAIATLIDRHPDLPVVIDHGGKPDLVSGGPNTIAFDHWRDGMRALAAHPSAHCKLSGLLTQSRPGSTGEDVLPAAATLLDLFGPERLIWGSDWPVVNLAGTYRQWLQLTEVALRELTDAERVAVRGGNAIQFYRLGSAGGGLSHQETNLRVPK